MAQDRLDFFWAKNKSGTDKIFIDKYIIHEHVRATSGNSAKSLGGYTCGKVGEMKKETLNPHRPAWMPSQVEDSLISTRSLLTPASSYRAMSRLALATISPLSKDNLTQRRAWWRQQISLQYRMLGHGPTQQWISPSSIPQQGYSIVCTHGYRQSRRLSGKSKGTELYCIHYSLILKTCVLYEWPPSSHCCSAALTICIFQLNQHYTVLTFM